MEAYMEGLVYQDYLDYWDYIHTDALLALQIPRTNFPDELIFIIYHQVSELNFKMILSELEQMSNSQDITQAELENRVRRINRYMDLLINSFDVMTDGMDQKQFLRFRMALLPASGFQSGQFRMIEIASTDAQNLVQPALRPTLTDDMDLEALYPLIYWKQGATELRSGTKTLTLRRFESKYDPIFLQLMQGRKQSNLRKKYHAAAAAEGGLTEGLRAVLRSFDEQINVRWRLVHYRSAMRYLHKDPVEIAATGGTNWQNYLPPGFQRNYLFPELWTDAERDAWGQTPVPNATTSL